MQGRYAAFDRFGVGEVRSAMCSAVCSAVFSAMRSVVCSGVSWIHAGMTTTRRAQRIPWYIDAIANVNMYQSGLHELYDLISSAVCSAMCSVTRSAMRAAVKCFGTCLGTCISLFFFRMSFC